MRLDATNERKSIVNIAPFGSRRNAAERKGEEKRERKNEIKL